MKNKVEKLVLTIDESIADIRIDKALATLSEIGSRSQATNLLKMGAVRRPDGKIVKPSHSTRLGETFNIEAPVIENDKLEKYDFKLDIVYEDDQLLVVNKPSGLVVHPAAGHAQDTLVNALLNYTDDLSLGYNEKRPGLVHRIDKGTSGLLVIAKTDDSQRKLALQFQKKTTHRLYRAITFGPIPKLTGTLRSYLRRHPEDRKRMASVAKTQYLKSEGMGKVSQDELDRPPEPSYGFGNKEILENDNEASICGKLAITHYRVTETHSSGLSLVELRLETGRTHQIRVHLSEYGYPIVGDNTYGSHKRIRSVKSLELREYISNMSRFALHAMELGFIHPTSQEKMIFKAPWPEDLLPLIEKCEFTRSFE